jgi:tetratricopeptide (TPR) repeat protein
VANTEHAALFEEALEAGRGRDYARAVDLLARLIASSDAYPQALLYLGRAYHALGEFPRAVQALHTFVRTRPESAPGRFFLGRALLALGEYPESVRQLRKAIELQPGFSAAYGVLGLAYLKARRPDKAIWLFARALEIDPQNKRLQVGYLNTALVLAIRLFHRGDFLDAARLFTEVLEQRRSSMLPHLYLATIYRELGRAPLALYHLDAAARISPDDPFLRLQKALILLSQGEKTAAAREIRDGARLLNVGAVAMGTPDEILRFICVNLFRAGRYREAVFYGAKLLKGAYGDPQLHALVAEAYRHMGDLQKAKNHYQRAIEKDRAALELRYGLLAVLWERGEYAELLSESARILQKNRSDETGGYFHSLALARTGSAIEQVLAELQQQVTRRGPDPVLMAELASAYSRAGMPELAEGWYVRSMKAAEPTAESLLSLAAVYEALGKRDKLGETFSRYLELAPDDRAVRRRLIHVLLEQDAFAEAADHITTLLPREPNNAKLKSTLAVCYRRSGRYPEALVIIRDLLSRDPGAEELVKAAVYCLDRMGARAVGMKAIESFMRERGVSLSLVLMLGVLQFQEEALEKAASTFRQAVSMAPQDWRANRNLGMVYRRMGNHDFAEKFLAKAAALRPEPSGEKPEAPSKTGAGTGAGPESATGAKPGVASRRAAGVKPGAGAKSATARKSAAATKRKA